jgi:hypothetical protein
MCNKWLFRVRGNPGYRKEGGDFLTPIALKGQGKLPIRRLMKDP